MELVEGEALDERIRSGPRFMDGALDITRQMAEAFEAAHEKGIVHRDLKARQRNVFPVAEKIGFDP